MLTKTRAAPIRSGHRPVGTGRRETHQDVRVRSAAVRCAHVSGDTDALDWRSDPHLLAILARGSKREREASEKDRFRRDELDPPARRAGPARQSSLRPRRRATHLHGPL